MKQNILKSLMLIAVLLTSTKAFAYDFESNGIYYNITSQSNLEVEVTSPNNAHYAYSLGDKTVYSSYSNDIVNIPETVNYNNRTYTIVQIGDYAFFGCSNLSDIIMPNSIKSINKYAFRECKKIASIIIPNSVTCIGDLAFYNCESLASITIPNTVTNIGYEAFSRCTDLLSIIIGDSVTNIDERAFYM